MKTNEIRITIESPPEKVFEYTIEPKNTPLWIDSARIETVDTEQINLGTNYINNYGVLTVTDYDRNKFFELINQKTGYVCSYSYRKVNDNETELIYFEYMQDESKLADPMKQESFHKLKEILETN